jgi:hypothetical protein
MQLITSNAGQDITETNYFSLPHNKAGKLLISLNAGAFRLLIPDPLVAELRSELAKVSWIRIKQSGEVATITLDDGSKDPYVISTSMSAFDRRPASSDSGKDFVFTAWTSDGRGVVKIFQSPCSYTRS